MRLLVLSSLMAVAASGHFLQLPDLFAGLRPQCPKPTPCVCVCDKEDSYRPPPPPPRYPVKPSYEMPPPPPPMAYQQEPPPRYVPAPSYAPPPPPPDYQVPYQRGVPPAPNMPVSGSYREDGDMMGGPPGSQPAYVPEFKHRKKAAA